MIHTHLTTEEEVIQAEEAQLAAEEAQLAAEEERIKAEGQARNATAKVEELVKAMNVEREKHEAEKMELQERLTQFEELERELGHIDTLEEQVAKLKESHETEKRSLEEKPPEQAALEQELANLKESHEEEKKELQRTIHGLEHIAAIAEQATAEEQTALEQELASLKESHEEEKKAMQDTIQGLEHVAAIADNEPNLNEATLKSQDQDQDQDQDQAREQVEEPDGENVALFLEEISGLEKEIANLKESHETEKKTLEQKAQAHAQEQTALEKELASLKESHEEEKKALQEEIEAAFTAKLDVQKILNTKAFEGEKAAHEQLQEALVAKEKAEKELSMQDTIQGLEHVADNEPNLNEASLKSQDQDQDQDPDQDQAKDQAKDQAREQAEEDDRENDALREEILALKIQDQENDALREEILALKIQDQENDALREEILALEEQHLEDVDSLQAEISKQVASIEEKDTCLATLQEELQRYRQEAEDLACEKAVDENRSDGDSALVGKDEGDVHVPVVMDAVSNAEEKAEEKVETNDNTATLIAEREELDRFLALSKKELDEEKEAKLRLEGENARLRSAADLDLKALTQDIELEKENEILKQEAVKRVGDEKFVTDALDSLQEEIELLKADKIKSEESGKIGLAALSEKHKREYDVLATKAKEYKTAIEETKMASEKHQEAAKDAQKNLEDEKIKIQEVTEEMETKLSTLEQELEVTKKALVEAKFMGESENELQKRLVSLQEAVAALKKENDEKLEKVEAAFTAKLDVQKILNTKAFEGEKAAHEQLQEALVAKEKAEKELCETQNIKVRGQPEMSERNPPVSGDSTDIETLQLRIVELERQLEVLTRETAASNSATASAADAALQEAMEELNGMQNEMDETQEELISVKKDLEEKIIRLESELAQANSDKNVFQKKITLMTTDCLTLESEIQRLQKANDIFASTSKESDTLFQVQQTHSEQMQEMHTKYAEQVNATARALTTVEELKKGELTMKDEVRNKTIEYEKNSKQVAEIQAQVGAGEAEKREVEAQLREMEVLLNEDRSTHLRERSELRKEVRDARAEQQQQLSKLEHENAALVADFETKLSEGTLKSSALQAELEHVKGAGMNKLQQSMDAKLKMAEQARSEEKAAHEIEVEYHKEKIEMLLSEHQRMYSEALDKNVHECDILKAKVETAEAETARTRVESKEAQELVESLELRMTALNTELASANYKVEHKKRDVDLKLSEAEDMRVQTEAYKEQNEKIEAESLQSQKELRQKVADLEGELASSQALLCQREGELQALMNNIDAKVQKQKTDLENKVYEAEMQLKFSRAEVESAKVDKQEREMAMKEAQKELTTLRRDFAEAQQGKASAEAGDTRGKEELERTLKAFTQEQSHKIKLENELSALKNTFEMSKSGSERQIQDKEAEVKHKAEELIQVRRDAEERIRAVENNSRNALDQMKRDASTAKSEYSLDMAHAEAESNSVAQKLREEVSSLEREALITKRENSSRMAEMEDNHRAEIHRMKEAEHRTEKELRREYESNLNQRTAQQDDELTEMKRQLKDVSQTANTATDALMQAANAQQALGIENAKNHQLQEVLRSLQTLHVADKDSFEREKEALQHSLQQSLGELSAVHQELEKLKSNQGASGAQIDRLQAEMLKLRQEAKLQQDSLEEDHLNVVDKLHSDVLAGMDQVKEADARRIKAAQDMEATKLLLEVEKNARVRCQEALTNAKNSFGDERRLMSVERGKWQAQEATAEAKNAFLKNESMTKSQILAKLGSFNRGGLTKSLKPPSVGMWASVDESSEPHGRMGLSMESLAVPDTQGTRTSSLFSPNTSLANSNMTPLELAKEQRRALQEQLAKAAAAIGPGALAGQNSGKQ